MILDEIINSKKKQLQHMDKSFLSKELPSYEPRDFRGAMKKTGISIIAEIKKASPSKGLICEDFSPEIIAKQYEKANIEAISVLTEKDYFLGNNSYLPKVKEVTSKPVLRKDFIIDEIQLIESRHLGADAVLLIVSVLKDELKRYYDKCGELGLFALTEVHDLKELEFALKCGCDIIGINNRNLKDFSVDLRNTERLINNIPKEVVMISESGIKTPEDIRYLHSLGVDGVLIGETFMKNINGMNAFLERCKA